jgi:hypothetical protein
MAKRCVAALEAVLAFGATAAYSAERHHNLHIVIETFDHSKQRYPAVGDWQIDKAGNLHIFVSKVSDQRYEFLVGMHEVIEGYLAVHAGVSPEAVDKFDRAYEATRKAGDDREPGDDPRAPFHPQHVFASKIERLLAKQLGVDWTKYDHDVSSKCVHGNHGALRGRPQIIPGGTIVAEDGCILRGVAAHPFPFDPYQTYWSDVTWWQNLHDIGHFNIVRVGAWLDTFTDTGFELTT